MLTFHRLLPYIKKFIFLAYPFMSFSFSIEAIIIQSFLQLRKMPIKLGEGEYFILDFIVFYTYS